MTDVPPRSAPRVTVTFYASGRTVLTVDGVSQRHPRPADALARVVVLAGRRPQREVDVRVLTVDGTRIRLVATPDGAFRDAADLAQVYTSDELAALMLALAALDDEPSDARHTRRSPSSGLLGPDVTLSPLPPW